MTEAFQEEDKMFFILTNSRGMTTEETEKSTMKLQKQ